MRENIRISAVIPTYNRGPIVARAIESALAQEYTASEVIVVDDGSSDDTRTIVESYGKSVRYLYQTNAGVSVARNRGIREAKFDWVAFLDSDDYWAPGHLRRIVNAIEGTRGEAALYFADLQVPRGDGGHHYWESCGVKIKADWEFRRDASEWAFMPIQPMMLQASVISRVTYLQIGGLPEHLRTREDTLLFFKLALLYPACAVSGCGTIMNSDDSIRLTQVYDGESLVYCEATIFLYKELLATLSDIGGERRHFLANSLGASYFAIGRVLFRRKKYWRAMRNLGSSFVVSPSVFAKEFGGSLVRQLFKTKAGLPAPRMGLDPKS